MSNKMDSTTTTTDTVHGFQRNTTTVDASPWILIGTTVVCFSMMILVVPLLVSWERRRKPPTIQSPSFQTILAWDEETRSILRLVAPYTLARVSNQFFSNCVLVLVAHFLGTREVAAYALVHILMDLTNQILMGPIYACITLCSHALGADNYLLVGQYMQLALGLYVGWNVPAIYYWWSYMRQTILWLRWGDEATAQLAETFLRSIWLSTVINGVTQSMTILWNITEHALASSFLEISRNGSTVLVLFWLFWNQPTQDSTLQLVGMVYSIVSLVFFAIAVGVSNYKGWIQPFAQGLCKGWAVVDNFSALQLLISTAMPLSTGELISQGEWAVLTFFASFMGPAEVAAWAILGNIWDLFYYFSEGVGDAAEIRISLHLGDNHPALAQLSTYKSLVVGLLSAISVTTLIFAMKNAIPRWFTADETIQELLRELVPFVGVANLFMMFGMNCWYVLGAQGKYGLATWITGLSSWTICAPLAAFSVLVCHFGLQGLASSLSVGYVTAGACLSYFTMVTDWPAVALKISSENAEFSDEEKDDYDEEKKEATETSSLLSHGNGV